MVIGSWFMEKVKSEICTKGCCCDIIDWTSGWEKADVSIMVKVDRWVIMGIFWWLELWMVIIGCQRAF